VLAGALFCISRSPGATMRPALDELEMLAVTVAGVMRRKEAEGALERGNRLKGAILASLPAHVAVLNRDGSVMSINDGREDSSPPDDVPCAIALALQSGAQPFTGDEVADGVAEAVAIIAAVCRGDSTGRHLEYRCSRHEKDRWFLMTAQPLRGDEQGAVVTHLEITERKLNEIALRESEDRFRHMADALPVAIRVSDTSGQCHYFNREWLQFTGRSMDQEVGVGWLESVHLDDRARSMDVFLRAFHQREMFRIDYRLRRHDGEYRWYVDTGVPRYGTDGAFHGYVGGAIDITDQKDAERMLRELNHRLVLAQDGERRRIARELHDHLSQQLALLAIDLQQLATDASKPHGDAVPILQEAWRRTAEIASDVHAISHRLHPSKMEALGLAATIAAHCRDMSRKNLAVRFEQQDVPRGLLADRALSVFRVVEEALSNVARHSGATHAQVALCCRDGTLVLRITDDGAGFLGGERHAGLGLVSMRERLESLEGTLSITSAECKGTTVEAQVPLSALVDPSAPVVSLPASSRRAHGPEARASGGRAESA